MITPKKKALLVGLQYENDEGDEENALRGPHRDVTEMRELLIDCYEYAPRDVVVLIDRNDPAQVQPTRETMLQEIQKLIKDARAGDRFFFHYAGYADQIRGNEKDGIDGCLTLADGEEDVITGNELRQYLVDPLPIGSNLVALFDCPSALKLEHSLCNRAYVPWISKGNRRSESHWNEIMRRRASNTRSQLISRLSTYRTTKSRETSGDELSHLSEGPNVSIKSPSFGSALENWHNSAVSISSCTGWCPPMRAHKANVISLAACDVDQLPWEDRDGSSMTKTIINTLRGNPHPSLVDLLTEISHQLHRMYLSLHSHSRSYTKQLKEFNRRRIARGLPPIRRMAMLPDTNNFQDLQMSSHRPLDRDAKWDL